MAEKLFELRRRTFDTPHFRGITFIETEAKSIINHVPGNYLPFSWTINPYRGCSHACKFCFARSTHTYMDMNAGIDFETKIVVKVNAAQLLHRELRAKKWKGEPIAMGTATDPYQRAEGKYKLMQGILDELIAVRNPFSILTKGTLILRDLDFLQEASEVSDVSTAFSIGTLDNDAWNKSEPGTPHPRKRMEAVRKLNEAGVPCGVMVAAVLPGITDGFDQLKEVVHAAVDAGATFVTPIMLHLRPKVKEVYMDWLGETYPHLVDRYEAMYGRSAYASKNLQKDLSDKVRGILAEAPKPLRPRNRWRNERKQRAERRRAEAAENEQLSLI
jgi:DNA repair photolyase